MHASYLIRFLLFFYAKSVENIYLSIDLSLEVPIYLGTYISSTHYNIHSHSFANLGPRFRNTSLLTTDTKRGEL